MERNCTLSVPFKLLTNEFLMCYRLDGRTDDARVSCVGGRESEYQLLANSYTALQTVRYHFNSYAGSCVALAL